MSDLNLIVRTKEGKIFSYQGHYCSAEHVIQTVGVRTLEKAAGEPINDDTRFDKIKGVCPYDAGIIVVDFKTKQVFDCQSGFDVHTELYMEKNDVPKDRQIVRETEHGVAYTDAPRVNEMIENGWNILVYSFAGHGIMTSVYHLERDLEEVGIKTTKPTAWWEWLNNHYLWAMMPRKEVYRENGKTKPYPVLTKEQRKVLRLFVEKAKPPSNREEVYSGEYVIMSFPANETAELKAIRQLEAKGYISHGLSGSVWTGKTVIRYSVEKEIMEIRKDRSDEIAD